MHKISETLRANRNNLDVKTDTYLKRPLLKWMIETLDSCHYLVKLKEKYDSSNEAAFQLYITDIVLLHLETIRVNRKLWTDFFLYWALGCILCQCLLFLTLFAGTSEFPGLWEATSRSSRFAAKAQFGWLADLFLRWQIDTHHSKDSRNQQGQHS